MIKTVSPNARHSWTVYLFVFSIIVILGGCSKHSDESRQNRRVVDAILTAVTLKNPKELDKDSAMWDTRLADGLLPERHYKTVRAIIEKARSGNWREAEDELYKFRETYPFPN